MRARHLLLIAVCLAVSVPASGQAPLRKIGEMEVSLVGLTATLDPVKPVVPKNVASGVRVVVHAGSRQMSSSEVTALLGSGTQVRAELSGPGLSGAITLPQQGDPLPTDPLLLPIPGLNLGGDYTLANLRLVSGGRTVLDVTPADATLQVIDQILVTSVQTQALTLDQIRQAGIVLDSDSYVGFQFTLGLQLQSTPVTFSFPVVFDQNGVALPPAPTLPPSFPQPEGVTLPPLPTIVPMLLGADSATDSSGNKIPLTLPSGQPVRIPSLLVIPGNVGYLKQFFSAKLFVANGAPVGSGLTLRDVAGTIKLPPSPGSGEPAPLSLPATIHGPQPSMLPITGPGFDGQPGTPDDTDRFAPGEQGQGEFLVRGDSEGFYTLDFDIGAVLDGLPVGPVNITGKASGGVLVRNPYLDMTFTVPSVVRTGEPFKLFATVTNIGKGAANLLHVNLDDRAASGARLVSQASQAIDTLKPGDSKALEFDFVSERTGKVVASYLHFDTETGVTGAMRFTLGVGERGVPLSPDTLVLPSSVDALPSPVVSAAMRVLGQAWSLANAPAGTLPDGVLRTSKTVVTQKALALAEAGLRVDLGQRAPDAVKDLAPDFYGGTPLDPGFDQLLRETAAGHELALALGAAMADEARLAGGALAYERGVAEVLASGSDFVSVAVSGPVGDVTLTDGAQRTTTSHSAAGALPGADIPGGVQIPIGSDSAGFRTLGLVTAPTTSPYALDLTAQATGLFEVSITVPRGDGTFVRGQASNVSLFRGGRARAVADLSRPDSMTLAIDADGDGVFEGALPLTMETIVSSGPRLVAASVIGPETLPGANPGGVQGVLLFDRVVNESAAAQTSSYQPQGNVVKVARRQLSGRIVLLALAEPEGPYVPRTIFVSPMPDQRGVVGGGALMALQSRIRDPGGVVTGRVRNADGTPVSSGTVVYSNNVDVTCSTRYASPISAVSLAADGSYEIRYVRQDTCGGPFGLATQDPETGEARTVSGFVRFGGERLILDIALLGRGSVSGTVRDSHGLVGGARVVALSSVDPQSGGSATTDGNGIYRIDGISVGPVSVKAVHGINSGVGAGRIARAGTIATVDVPLNDGGVGVTGRVRVVQNGTDTPLPGVYVIFYAINANSGTSVAAGVVTTGPDGGFAFSGMPAGSFQLSTYGTGHDVTKRGTAGAGQQLLQQDLVIVLNDTINPTGTIRGSVRLPDGTLAQGAIVTVDGGGVVATDGTYAIPGVPVKANQSQVVEARSADGLRSGSAPFILDTAGQELSGVDIALSGLGSAQFTVKDPLGNLVNAQQVLFPTDRCADACGCNPRTTAQGVVRIDGVPPGAVWAQAVRLGAPIDVAMGVAIVPGDGTTGFATLQFAGSGTVKGTVVDPDGKPLGGVTVNLSAMHFVHDELDCGLQGGTAASTQTDIDGQFQFRGVNVGSVGVTATSEFYPTQVGALGTLQKDGGVVTFNLRMVNTIAGVLSGTVSLPDGTPAGAGVEVTANGPLPDVTVRTDAQGKYHFAKIFPAGGYTVTASDPVTGGTARDSVSLPADKDIVHDFRLKGRGTVKVTVVDGAGQPVGNAFVSLTETEYPSETFDGVLDASNQGVVTFDRVFEGPFSVVASDTFGRGGRAASVLPAPGASVEIKVPLTTTGTVTGHFYMPDGVTAIPYGSVQLSANGRVIGTVTTQGSGDVGGFSFDYVPAGALQVTGSDPLSGRTGLAGGSLAQQDQMVTLNVIAEALGTVEGTVTTNGSPEGFAQVDVYSGVYHSSTSTDDVGHYVIPGVPAGHVVATASLAQGLRAGTAAGSLNQEGQDLVLDVALRGSGSVDGRVVEADGQTPAPPSLVTIQVGGIGGGSFTAVTDGDGHFQFQGIFAGLATLTCSVLGGIDQGQTTANVPIAATVSVTLTLNGTGAIDGLATGAAGDAVAGSVTIQGTGSFPYGHTLAVPGNGVFRLSAVLAGPFTGTLWAQIGGFTLYGSATAAVVPGQTTHFAVSLQPSGTVTGRVLRPDGITPAYGASVSLRLDASGATVAVQAQTDGAFELKGVPLGVSTVKITDPVTAALGFVPGVNLASDDEVLDLHDIVLNDRVLALLSADPADGTQQVAVDHPLVLTFTNPLQGPGGVDLGPIGANPALSADGLTLTITPWGGRWPDTADIVYTVTTAVTDVFGRHPLQSQTGHFRTVDLTPPSVASTNPARWAQQVSPNARITIAFGEDLLPTQDVGSIITVSGPTGPISGSAAFVAPRSVTFTPNAPLQSDSAYNVTINGSIDLSGNQQTAPDLLQFTTVDTAPPTVAFYSTAGNITGGAWLALGKPTITTAFYDGLTGPDMATATLSLDGSPVSAQVQGNTLVFTPGAALADRTHTLVASVADRAGNVGTLSVMFGVDTTAPVVASVGGVSDGQIVWGTVNLVASVAEAGSGLSRVELIADGTLTALFSLADLSLALNSGALGEGHHVFAVRATDVAGNVGAAGPSLAVVVDNQPLGVVVQTPPTDGQVFGASVTVVASPSEPVAQLDISIGGRTVSVSAAPYQATFDLTGVAEGTQIVTVQAFGQGNPASATRRIIVDHTPPSRPDAAKLAAQASDSATAIVLGRAAAVESGASVEIVDTANNSKVTVTAAGDGSFAANIQAAQGDALSLLAIDSVGNRSGATSIAVGAKQATGSVPLAGLRLWLKADAGIVQDADGHVSAWRDQSPDANDAEQSSTAAQPLWASDSGSGVPALRFDGTSSFLSLRTTITTGQTAFLVLRNSGASGYRTPLGDPNGLTYLSNYGRQLWYPGNPAVVLTGQTWLNGVPVDGAQAVYPDVSQPLAVLTSIATAPVVPASQVGLGYGGYFWLGDIAEVLIYDVQVSPTDRVAIEDYLALKYGCYVPKTAAPVITSPGGRFSGSTTVDITSTSPNAAIRFTVDGSDPATSLSAQDFLGPFVISASTTIKAVATAPDLPVSDVTTVTLTSSDDFSPASLAGLQLWLRADAGITPNGGFVDLWQDQSGNGNDAAQATGYQSPALVTDAPSGMPALRFDGANDFLSLRTRIANAQTAFLVLRNSDASGYRTPLGDPNAFPYLSGYGRQIWYPGNLASVLTGQTWLNGAPVDGTQAVYPDVTQPLAVLTSIATAPAVPASQLGSGYGGYLWQGDIAEVVLFDHALTGPERHQVEEYLMRKYASVPALPPSTPAITPNGGRFTGVATISLSETTPGAVVTYTLDGSDPTPASATYHGPFSISATTTVKAKAFLGGLASSTGIAGFIESADQSPGSLSGLRVWLRADAGVPPSGGFVDLWKDQSGNEDDASQGVGYALPALAMDASSGLPVLRFDGSNAFLSLKTPIATGQTVFLVLRNSSPAGYHTPLGDPNAVTYLSGAGRQIWYYGDAAQVLTGQTWLNGAPVDGTQAVYPDASASLAILTSIATDAVVPTAYVASGYAGYNWQGDIAEVVVYDRALTEAEGKEVATYLAKRYRIVSPNLPW